MNRHRLKLIGTVSIAILLITVYLWQYSQAQRNQAAVTALQKLTSVNVGRPAAASRTPYCRVYNWNFGDVPDTDKSYIVELGAEQFDDRMIERLLALEHLNHLLILRSHLEGEIDFSAPVTLDHLSLSASGRALEQLQLKFPDVIVFADADVKVGSQNER